MIRVRHRYWMVSGSRWRTAKPSDVDALVSDISVWQQALWKFSSVGHIGKVDGPKAWMEAVDPVVGQQEFRVKLTPPICER